MNFLTDLCNGFFNFILFLAAAAAAKAQLAQVPPPEHLKFPENDAQVPGTLLPPNEKAKRRRKRKVDIADPNSINVNPQSPQDEPPLKVVPHPVKYKSVAEAGATDLEVCFTVLYGQFFPPWMLTIFYHGHLLL